MLELTEFESGLKIENEEQKLLLSSLFSSWLVKRKENRKKTFCGIIISTIMLVLMATKIISGELFYFYTPLGITTILITCILPTYDTYFGRQMQLLSSELLRRMIMLKKEFARMIEELDYDVEPVYVKKWGGIICIMTH